MALGFVGTRRRGTLSASRSASTRRSVASSRFRHWLRSSCAIARSTGPGARDHPALLDRRQRLEASTSKTASTRVSVFCACWPPGPLEREKRSSISETGMETERVTRIESPVMAAILLDVDGVFHVSGEPIPGGADAVRALREAGHRLRFVTNNTTRSRAQLAEELRGLGVELEDEELQTTPRAAAHALAGRRVLALTMQAIVEDLEGIELVGDGADAVLLGGADETEETGRVFSYMNLARAFAELEGGRRALLPAQEPLVADGARAAARRRRVRRRARVRRRDRGDRPRQAEPGLLRRGARGSRRRSPSAPGSSATTSRRTSPRSASACAPCSCGRASSGPTRSSSPASTRR